MNSSLLRWLCLVGTVVGVSSLVYGDNSIYGVSKNEHFEQTDAGTVTASSGSPSPFEFYAFADSSMPSVSSSSFHASGGSTFNLIDSPNNDDYEYQAGYASQSAMDSAFPDGNFIITIGSSVTLNLSGDNYPNTPQVISVTNGAWSNGQLVVTDPTQDCVLYFNTFTNYASVGVFGHQDFNISGNNDSVNLEVQDSSNTNVPPYSATPFTSFTIPANTLTSGNTYSAELDYTTVITFNPSSITNYYGLGYYQVETDFTILAGGGGNNQPIYGLGKQERFVQTAAGTIITDPTAPFRLESFANPSIPSTTSPDFYGAGVSAIYLSYSSDDNQYEYNSDFSNKSGLDSAFPDESYTMAWSGQSVSLSLGSDLYPVTPQVTAVTNGTWSNNQLVVTDPTQDCVLYFNTFTSYASAGAGSHESFELSGNSDSVDINQQIFSSPSLPPYSATPFTTFTIPANTLTLGNTYTGTLDYTTVTGLDTTSITNYIGVAFFETENNFTIHAGSSSNGGLSITSQPTDTSVNVGDTATFSVGFTPGGGVSPRWYYSSGSGPGVQLTNGTQTDGSIISGAHFSVLTIDNAQTTDTGSYFVVLSYESSSVTSNGAYLTVNSPPVFTQQPVPAITAGSGQTAVFRAVAKDTNNPSDTITFQWYKNSNPMSDGGTISGTTSKTLYFSNVVSGNAGTYTCVATNPAGSVTSNPAVLTYSTSTDLGRIINLSIRDNCGTGADQLIAGFVIGGPGTDSSSKTLLIRGDGPTIASYGVTGALPDPALNVFEPSISTTLPLYSNTGWGNNSTDASVASQVGAFALNTDSLDSALVESLTPGVYTANITGNSGDTGVALAELYDATTGFTSTTPRLINVSGRAQVANGAASLIAGFVIGGSTEKTVLVRGIGPMLANYGVTGVLADPHLEVHQLNPDGTDAGVLASNGAWGGGGTLTNVFTQVGAFALTDPNSLDTALLISLPPGVYTANVTSASGGTGDALVEVYEVP